MTDNSTLLTLGEADTTLALALIFGFVLLALGFKEKMFWLLAGPCWILFGITIFMAYDVAFMFMSVGLGLVLLFMGALNVRR
jgi:hypothetical protein